MADNQNEVKSDAKDYRVESVWEGGLRTKNLVRDFELKTDDPYDEFGTNTAPEPVEMFLCSIGACIITTYAWIAFTSRLSLTAMTTSVSGKIETVDGKRQVVGISAKLKVKSLTNNPEKLERSFRLMHENCLLLNSLEFQKKVDFDYEIIKS